MMIFRGTCPGSKNNGGPRPERLVLIRLFAFIGLSFLVHILLAQLNWYEESPAVQQAERLIISLFTPPEPTTEPTPVPPAPTPGAPRTRPAPPKPAPPALGTPAETLPAVESPTAEAEMEGSPEGEEEGHHASEMDALVKRIQKKAAPPPDQPAMIRATPRIETNPRPQYPAMARANRWQGVVHMQVWVSDEGRVDKIDIVKGSGHDVLDDAAINAVRYWRFVPARRGDEVVPDVVPVSIVLPQKK